MKKQGIGIAGLIVFVGLIALIVWGLNYILTKDFVILRTPTAALSTTSTTTTVAIPTAKATTTPTTAQNTPPKTTPTATSTETKKPAPIQPTQPATTTPTSAALTVTFTDKGFSPANLTIKKNQTVTFVNNSSGKMWVAANPFPSSSEYPDFNEKSGIASGASWSFTFDKTGVWFYHNHFSPAQGAKIVVNAK